MNQIALLSPVALIEDVPSQGRIRQSDAEWLQQLLLLAAREEEVSIVGENRFGRLYVLDMTVKNSFGSAVVRSRWIVQFAEDFPPLTTSYVKRAE